MLSMKERLELGSQLNSTGSQLKETGLGMMERLKLSGTYNSILAKLKGAVAPKPAPEKRQPLRYSSSIGSKAKEGDTILNAKMDTWAKKYKAENAINAAGLQGLAIATGSDALGWKIQMLEQLPEGTVLEVFEHTTKIDGMDAWQYSVKIKGAQYSSGKLLPIAKAYDSDAKVIQDDEVSISAYAIEQMAREKLFKLDYSNLSSNGRDVFDSDLGDKPESAESDLIIKFKAGEFNGMKPAEFVEVMRDVHTDGLPLDGVKKGVIEWFKANPSLIADKAA